MVNFLGWIFEEVNEVYFLFFCKEDEYRFLKIIYYLGKGVIIEIFLDKKRFIIFSFVLRECLGYYIYGEWWVYRIKKVFFDKGLLGCLLYIISVNMYSVMNSFFVEEVLIIEKKGKMIF